MAVLIRIAWGVWYGHFLFDKETLKKYLIRKDLACYPGGRGER